MSTSAAADHANFDERFYLETVAHLTHLPVHLTDADGNILLDLSGWKDDTDPLVADKNFVYQLINTVKAQEICIFRDIGPVVFAACVFTRDRFVIIGPCIGAYAGPAIVRTFAQKHAVRMRPLNRLPLTELTAAIGQIYYLASGKTISLSKLEDSIVSSSLNDEANAQIMKVMIRQYETVVPHNDGSWEIIRRKAIMSGDLEALQRWRDSPYSGKRGVVGPNALRNAKNLALVDVTVSSRAALDAGLDSETVYTISDGYLLQIERVKTETEADAIAQIAAQEFTRLIKELKEKHYQVTENTSSAFIKARDFIIRNIYARLSLTCISKETGISSDYLETLFKQEIGMTVKDFVIERKIEQSIVLMKNESLTLEDIVGMLGYSSMSNFIAQFKKHKGQTPAKFRRALNNGYVCTPNLEQPPLET